MDQRGVYYDTGGSGAKGQVSRTSAGLGVRRSGGARTSEMGAAQEGSPLSGSLCCTSSWAERYEVVIR